MKTSVHCFKRIRDDGARCGVWLLNPDDGIFFHGDREEAQVPIYDLEQLATWAEGDGFLPVEKIKPEQAIAELESWPAAQRAAREIFTRHAF